MLHLYSKVFRANGNGAQITEISFFEQSIFQIQLRLSVPNSIFEQVSGVLEQNVPQVTRGVRRDINQIAVYSPTTKKIDFIVILEKLRDENYISAVFCEEIKAFILNFGTWRQLFSNISIEPSVAQSSPAQNNTKSYLSEMKDGHYQGEVKTEIDYYSVLEISKYASTKEIKTAYLKLAKIKHPDRSKNVNANEEFSLIQEAYNLLINPLKRVEYDKNYQYKNQPLLIKAPFHNSETFFFLTSVDEIEPLKLIELDGYAFDSDELVEYAKQDIYKLYNNPHILDRNQNTNFSPSAKNKMKANPLLNSYIIDLENRLASQEKGIKPQTVDVVILMLNEFHQKGVEGSADAKVAFLEHKYTLTPQEQLQLDYFVIRMPCIGGGFQPLLFDNAINGGNLVDQCIITSQMYGWQFVVMLRPNAIILVPEAVKNMARNKFLKIEAPVEAMPTTHSSSPQNSANWNVNQGFQRFFFADNNAMPAGPRVPPRMPTDEFPDIDFLGHGRLGFFELLQSSRDRISARLESIMDARFLAILALLVNDDENVLEMLPRL